jgi:hypothetical protein
VGPTHTLSSSIAILTAVALLPLAFLIADSFLLPLSGGNSAFLLLEGLTPLLSYLKGPSTASFLLLGSVSCCHLGSTALSTVAVMLWGRHHQFSR